MVAPGAEAAVRVGVEAAAVEEVVQQVAAVRVKMLVVAVQEVAVVQRGSEVEAAPAAPGARAA